MYYLRHNCIVLLSDVSPGVEHADVKVHRRRAVRDRVRLGLGFPFPNVEVADVGAVVGLEGAEPVRHEAAVAVAVVEVHRSPSASSGRLPFLLLADLCLKNSLPRAPTSTGIVHAVDADP